MLRNKSMHEWIAGLIVVLLGGISVFEAIRLYPMRISTMVGDHTMPALLGVILILLGVLLVLLPSKENVPVKFSDKNTMLVILSTLVIMFGYWALLEYLGYILSTIIASILLYRIIGGYKWIKSGIYAFITSAFIYTIFVLLLKMVLPAGIFSM